MHNAAGLAAGESQAAPEVFDVLVIGAGLSGIGAGCHLRMRCPGKTFAILERRAVSGGTWDLFRYPGVRSDSDMYTLGYSFRPWREAKAIADGPSILNYVRETAAAYGVDRAIRYDHAVKRVSWSRADSAWTVEVERGAERDVVWFKCTFLFACCGYYDYGSGYMPEFPDIAQFGGRLVHPQHWPDDLDYAGKRVVVIGSGATAVTLVPAMAREAAHVTMLQRSPTYVVSRPSEDPFANRMRRRLPDKLAYAVTRWRNVLLSMFFYRQARRKPEAFTKAVLGGVRHHLGPDYDIATHFTPRYKPWDQRLCLVPDSDLFRVLKGGQASIVTDHIERFTPTGIRLRSGAELEADLVVSATGLRMQVMSGMEVLVDGERIELSRTMSYKGMMFSGVPNLAVAFGYTNASWTLKCDLTCEYVCRLLKYMDRQGYAQCTPLRDGLVEEEPFLDFTSGYVQRALDHLPRQGSKKPWKLYQNYALDLVALRFGKLSDGTMKFERKAEPGRDGTRRAA